jgi:hypothetical protein
VKGFHRVLVYFVIKIEKAEKLENECLEKVFDLSDELEQAKVNKADHKLIKGLETKLIQAKAKRQFASEEAEQILKSIDEVLRSDRNDAKTEKATDQGMCHERKDCFHKYFFYLLTHNNHWFCGISSSRSTIEIFITC